MIHQYIERETGAIRTEKLYRDRMIRMIYNTRRERPGLLFRAVTSSYTSRIIGILNYDIAAGPFARNSLREMQSMGMDLEECLDDPRRMNTMRKIFERKIKYDELRPMNLECSSISSPADSRLIAGSLSANPLLFIKEKFFNLEELLGFKNTWIRTFSGGDFAVFRLTPEKYHWNHSPVSGIVEDIYEIGGAYNSCNPHAVISIENSYSKNRRCITIINTDVPGGSQAGHVAMIEVAALMIGRITQAYSETGYSSPQKVLRGMFIRRGQPKSYYSPGSSVDIVLFQKGRIRFSEDIIDNLNHPFAMSRFSRFFGKPLIETEVKVRTEIAKAIPCRSSK